MVALGASKGGSTGDDDGRVANCWRPARPCTSRSFAAACSVGGSGGPDGLGTAWGSLELRVERGSNVAMRPSACGCMRMVAELLLGHHTPCMLPRSTPGVPFHSTGLFGPPWVAKVVHCGVWVIGPHTHCCRRGGGGGPTSGWVPVGIIKSFLRAVFCVIPSSIGPALTLEHS